MPSKTLLFTLLLLLLSACGGAAVDPNTPPEIVYGEDVCSRCGMIISDTRFAAALVVEKGSSDYEHLFFDDPGEMFAFAAEEGEAAKIVRWYVHDYNSREWTDGANAWYVLADALQSPMGFGVAACADEAQAASLAQSSGGRVLSFAQAREELGKVEGMNAHGHP